MVEFGVGVIVGDEGVGLDVGCFGNVVVVVGDVDEVEDGDGGVEALDVFCLAGITSGGEFLFCFCL